jgi:hypothetical protein
MSSRVEVGRAHFGGSVPEELDDVARTIIDSNLYMTIGTADRDGRPGSHPSTSLPI